MAKPDLQPVELRAGLLGLSAWVDGKLLGRADVIGTDVIITAMARQVERGPVNVDLGEDHPLKS
jgi:hypothetical protein